MAIVRIDTFNPRDYLVDMELSIPLKEYELVEKPAIDLLHDKLGYDYLDGRTIKKEANEIYGKTQKSS